MVIAETKAQASTNAQEDILLIKQKLSDINQRDRDTIMDTIKIGQALHRQKEQVPEGEWQQWLKDNFNLTYRTAKNYMDVATKFETIDMKSISGLNVTQLIVMLKIPQEKIVAFLKLMEEQGTPVPGMTIKELQAKVNEYLGKTPMKSISSQDKSGRPAAKNDQAKQKKLNSLADTLNGRQQPVEESEPYLKLKEENSALTDRIQQLEQKLQDTEGLTEQVQKLKDKVWSLETDIEQYKLMKNVLNEAYRNNDNFARYVDNEGAGDGAVLFMRNAIPYTDLKELVTPFLVRCGLSQKLPDTLEELRSVATAQHEEKEYDE